MERKKRIRRILEVIKKTSIFFTIYFIVLNIFPFIRPKKVSSEFIDYQENRKYPQGSGDRIILVEDTNDAYNARIALIQESEDSLDIAYHLIVNCESTDPILGEIYEAANRGVRVRILIDGKVNFIKKDLEVVLKALASHENIEVKKYNPISFLKPWKNQAVLHDKFFIVDDKYLLIGGRNIGDKYFNPVGYQGIFSEDRDVLIWHTKDNIEVSVIAEINKYMNDLWELKSSVSIEGLEDEAIINRLLDSRPVFYEKNPTFVEKSLGEILSKTVATKRVYLLSNSINESKKEPWIAYQLRKIGYEAEEKISIQTPYSTGNKYLLEALSDYSESKEVEIITNSRASTPNIPAFSNYYSQRKKFLKAGVRLFELQSRDSIHGKSIIFDDRISAVGSFNLDDRSFYLSTETMVIVESEEFASILKDAIYSYKDQSLEVGRDNKYIADDILKEVDITFMKKFILWLGSIFSRLFQFLI